VGLERPPKTKSRRETAPSPDEGKFRLITVVPTDRQRALDHALEETFPASDPISITISEVVRVGRNGTR
jgi:hypothetical protein